METEPKRDDDFEQAVLAALEKTLDNLKYLDKDPAIEDCIYEGDPETTDCNW